MNLTSLTSADCRKVLKLIEQRESLIARLTEIDASLTRYDGTPGLPGNRGGRPSYTPSRQKRGELKSRIVALLQGAGKTGITVKDIAGKLGVKAGNIYVWFNSTGKKMKEIKKVSAATYTWAG